MADSSSDGGFGQGNQRLQEKMREPGRFDVLLGRGKGNQQHVGNQRFQGAS